MTKRLSSDEQVPLHVGMQLKFLGDFPEYTVTAIDVNIPTIELTLTDHHTHYPHLYLPHHLIINSNFNIGRASTNNGSRQNGLVISEVSCISRNHGAIHFDTTSNQWYYTHYGRNEAVIEYSDDTIEIINRSSPEHHPNRVYEGTVTFPDPREQDSVSEILKIVDGMSFHFHPALPAYKASIRDVDGVPQLILDSTHTDVRAPTRITVNKGETLTLGRESGVNRAVLVNPTISRNHARIFWDDTEHGFVYEPLGKFLPIIRMPDLLRMLQNMYTNEKFSTWQAQEQLSAISALTAELEMHKEKLRAVQKLEINSVSTPLSEHRHGGYTEDSQKGYELWLRVFELLFRERLEPESSQRLVYMANAIGQMGKDRSILREIEHNYAQPDFGFWPTLEDIKKPSDRSAAIQQYVNQKTAQLERDGELYLVSGYQRHHTVTRIKKDGVGHLVTTYNAGGDAVCADDGEGVLGTVERRLKKGTDVQEFIWLTTERKLWERYNPVEEMLANAVDASMESDILRSHTVSPQHKGNCTTRSTREMLRDTLSPDTFNRMHGYVSNPTMATVEDLQSALEMKKLCLEKFQSNDGQSHTNAPFVATYTPPDNGETKIGYNR